MSEIHISFSAEQLFTLGNILPVTNSLMTTWLVMGLLTLLVAILARKLKIIPSYIQQVLEIIVGGLYDLFSSVTGEKTRQFFPLIATLFLFIVSLNWAGILPGVGTIGIHKIVHRDKAFIPFFRAGTADLNATLAFAIITMLVIQYYGLKTLGVEYIKRFINFSSPVHFFVGILEIISEIAKIISFSFRLFGNIFAGEVLLTVVAFLMPLFAPLPFIGLELFVGFIQALVFSMLATVFLNVATSRH